MALRKIEQEMLDAIRHQRGYNKGNTQITFSNLGEGEVRLHGNLIATLRANGVPYRWHVYPNDEMFTRYPTRTTSSRLRALGCKARVKNGVAETGGPVLLVLMD